jgi:diaminobutyrate-2-oxoglutarate transaminase
MIRKLLEDPSSGLEPPAAFLLETIQAEGGLRCASPAWLRDLAALAAELGSLIIVDDIQAGCGRCGTFFSFEDAGIRPDIVCLSKSIGGFGLPMSLVLFDQRHDVWKPGEHNGTFRGNNLAFVTAATALAFWRDPSFVETLMQRGAQLENGLAKLVQEIGDPSFSSRGRGVMHGLVCPDGEIAGAISRKAFEGGLLVETCGPHDEVVKCLPPITISQEHLAEGLARLSEAALAVLYERTPLQTRYAAE